MGRVRYLPTPQKNSRIKHTGNSNIGENSGDVVRLFSQNMNKDLKFYLITFAIVITGGIFYGFNFAHASEYDQLNHNNDYWVSSGNTYYYWQALGNGLSGNLTSLCLWGRSSTGNVAIDWYENNDDSNAGNINAQTKITGGGSFTTYGGVPGSNKEFCLDMSGLGINFNPSKYYSFVVNYASGGGNETHFYGSGSNTWGSTTDNLYYHAQAPSDTGGDSYFRILTVSDTNSVSLSVPAENATSSDFTDWNIPYHINSDSWNKGPILFNVVYGKSTTTLQYYLNNNLYAKNWPDTWYDMNSFNLWSTTATTSLEKTKLLQPGDYYAGITMLQIRNAYTSSSVVSILATSTLIKFGINSNGIQNTSTNIPTKYNPYASSSPGYNNNIVIGGIVATSTCGSFSWDDWSPVGCYASNVWKGAVNDVASGLNSTADTIGGLIKKMFPLNIAYHIADDFNQVASTASSSQSIVLSKSGLWNNHSYQILSASAIDNISTTYNFDFRGLFDKIIWTATGLLIIMHSLMVINHLRKENNNNV